MEFVTACGIARRRFHDRCLLTFSASDTYKKKAAAWIHPAKAGALREEAVAELAELQTRITPIQAEINQLARQFWVEKKQVVANKYDLSASRYRQVEQDDEYYERPTMTLERLVRLEASANSIVSKLRESLS